MDKEEEQVKVRQPSTTSFVRHGAGNAEAESPKIIKYAPS